MSKEEIIKKLNDIHFELETYKDDVIDVEIKGKIDKSGKDLNYEYIASDIAIENAMEELDKIESYINDIFTVIDK